MDSELPRRDSRTLLEIRPKVRLSPSTCCPSAQQILALCTPLLGLSSRSTVLSSRLHLRDPVQLGIRSVGFARYTIFATSPQLGLVVKRPLICATSNSNLWSHKETTLRNVRDLRVPRSLTTLTPRSSSYLKVRPQPIRDFSGRPPP